MVSNGGNNRVFLASNGIEGQRQIETENPHVVTTDTMMLRMGGFPVLEFRKTIASYHRFADDW